MREITVNRCICHKKLFKDIIAELTSSGYTLASLENYDSNTIQDVLKDCDCCQGCKFCLPYIQQCIQNRTTEYTGKPLT